ncbi:hypothetical protein FX988_02956 [Paraglaciecola mesophila]|uniref:Uncharacterized protein n=1 Tax=Paraglaciecola mesophila TaxID=197222 RepID=A0A857JMX5_9ALTE|nr:hypothetical protein [Paraglaciecola mesophila]QHJ12698.1 hypothetical protein FX988_02956 [Paraglaciecola mesophila]
MIRQLAIHAALVFLLLRFDISTASPATNHAQATTKAPYQFDKNQDLLLLHFDLKTDVDDVHTIAAMHSILQSPQFNRLNYWAVSGTYGIQSGLYVPADHLFDLVFNANWTNAHMQRQKALNDTVQKVSTTLAQGGRVWISEAGQSDFTQHLIQQLKVNGTSLPKEKIVLVQHSEWNEKETSKNALAFVKQNTTYYKIPDGNASANGTPGFNTLDFTVNPLENNPLLDTQIWQEANKVSSQYNGVNGRYLNKTIHSGGADFSDLVEVVWILGITGVNTVDAFFTQFNPHNPSAKERSY